MNSMSSALVATPDGISRLRARRRQPRRGLRVLAQAWLLASATACLLGPALASAATFTVDSPADVADANPGDGICETAPGNHVCTLRAALREANALPGADTIVLQANTTYVLTTFETFHALSSDLVISDSVTITGAGPASTVIDGNGETTGRGVFYISRCIEHVAGDGNGCALGEVVVNLSGLTIEHGVADTGGGGIHNDGTLVLDDSVVSDNTVQSSFDGGGGIFNNRSLTLTRSTVANNVATGPFGGGIFSEGPLVIRDSTIRDNVLSGTNGTGGGLHAFVLSGDSAVVSGSTFSGNHAPVGGGIYSNGDIVDIINTTVSGNSSGTNGGGVYAGASAGTVALYNVTVTQNVANADADGSAIGGGVYVASGATMTLLNSIVSKNKVIVPTLPSPTLDVDDCGGTLTSQGGVMLTFVKSAHCTILGPHVIDDPLLGPLQSNGGPTQTHALLDGSPAIDAVTTGACTDQLGQPLATDQRGVARPYGAFCDIGAFEAADRIFADGFGA